MWFDGAGEVVEMFKSSFPLSFLFFVPIFILISPVCPVASAHDFAVYRMQQYDLQGTNYGCRNALLNVEARPIDSRVVTRRCVVTRLQELTVDKFKEIVTQNAAGLLILLPEDISKLSPEETEHLMQLEQDLLQEESQVPVYFSQETPELREMYSSIVSSTNSDQAGSAVEALLGAATANGFQLTVNGAASKALNDFQVVNIQGKLSGYGIEEQLPTIALVAHYDAFGIAPSVSKGADSNGSGVVALLEIARLFSKLYTNSRTHAKYNMLFLLSGAGKFNYQGTKRWIEDQLDSSDSSLLQDVSFVLCLDAIGSSDDLFLHVSKPPKEGSPGALFMQNLEEVAKEFFEEVKFKMMHKKINLAEDFLAWEHERFSIRRLPAFTLSHLDSHKKNIRNSIVDDRNNVDSAVVARNVKIIVESLARHVFNLTQGGDLEIFNEGLKVEENLISAWLDYLTQRPRAAQLLDKDSAVVTTLEQGLSKFVKDVKKLPFKADKRDPEFVFYSGSEYTMNSYNVKPAVFDLFLGLAIAAYLAIVYVVAQNFNVVYTVLRKLKGPVKPKVH